MSLDGKIIVVTGAAGALGSSVCALLEDLGGTVVRLDMVRPVADRVEQVFELNLTDEQSVRSRFQAIAARNERIDGLVNLAGAFRWQTLTEGDISAWDHLYEANLRTAALCCMAVLPFLPRPGGRIVNIGANAAVKATDGMGAYAASKAGVAKLTEALSEELKSAGITVNAVLPGIIDTPANRSGMPDADHGLWVPPHHIADLIAFLLSTRAASITGALVPVTGRA